MQPKLLMIQLKWLIVAVNFNIELIYERIFDLIYPLMDLCNDLCS